MKKIISFALWGQNPLYCNGAIWNAVNRERFYPGWICRFYVDGSIPAEVYRELEANECEIRLMPESIDVLGMYWRFRPMFDDSSIERFLVRDTDSKFTIRETDMVNEWIETGKPFHIIRDNPSHNVPILGGTWGAVPGCIPQFRERMAWWLSNVRPDERNPRGLFHGTDQIFLAGVAWPFIEKNHCAHVQAGYDGLKFTGQEIEVLPPVDGHYVGAVL